MNGVILVEGISDQRAVATLAARRGRDLEAEGVSIVPIGGAHGITPYLERYGPAGLGADLSRADMEALGFFVCEADLEHELVRALGLDVVARIVEREGEWGRFETFRKQLAKRELSLEEQLWGFMWNRKIRYATLLVDALDLDRVPRPLDGVLAAV